MENNKPLNQFEEVHKRVREARDHAREVQERDAEARQERAEKEAVREGFEPAWLEATAAIDCRWQPKALLSLRLPVPAGRTAVHERGICGTT